MEEGLRNGIVKYRMRVYDFYLVACQKLLIANILSSHVLFLMEYREPSHREESFAIIASHIVYNGIL